MIKNLKLESTLLKVQRLILDNYFFLINNMYGNYVIQVALEVSVIVKLDLELRIHFTTD
jgi:hypothetical protein